MAARPNFVFILADDFGYADLGCYGGRSPCSPVLDRMAREGVRFTDGYANSALCSPSRFALITGRYQYRFRGAAEEPLTERTRDRLDVGLPAEHPTLPSLLRAAGYATALCGKWHLGYPPRFGPRKSGYDEFFGSLSGAVDYFTHCNPAGRHDLYDGDREVACTGYLTDLITARACDFVRRMGERKAPFFLSVHYTAPHWPWETRDDAAVSAGIHGRIQHTDGGSVALYQTMIRHMDEGIGLLFDALERTGANANTLVVFTSDNGGERFSDTWPLVGTKMDLLEGGIRVPMIARWPGRIPPGGVTDQVAILMDWLPTMLAAADVPGSPTHPPDGRDVAPVLVNPAATFRRDLFWRLKFRDQRAMRSGTWKYLALQGDEFLFDLARDPRERANRARAEPGALAEMKQRFETWEATMPPIPADAVVSHAYTRAEVAAPSSSG